MKWNVKCKIYPDGSTNTIYCNQKIFNDTPTERKPRENKSNENPLLKRKFVLVGKRGVNDEVRSDSLKRAKDKIQDIVLCNQFDYFVTLTFNPQKVDSFSVEDVKKAFKVWLSNGVSRYNFKYVAIPEYHKSGRIHVHALMSGDLKLVDSGHRHNDKIIYNIADWQEKFGFCTAIPIDGNIASLSLINTLNRSVGGSEHGGGGSGGSRTPVTDLWNDICNKKMYLQKIPIHQQQICTVAGRE